MKQISRRGFLEAAASVGAGALSLAALGCAGPVRSAPDPRLAALPKAEEEGSVVLGRYGPDVAMQEICARVLPKVTDFGWLRPGDSVLVKVACNSPNEHPAVTDPEAVVGLVRYLVSRGAGKVVVADMAGVEHVRLTKSGRVSSTREAMQLNGLAEAAARAGAELHCFDDQGWDAWINPRLDFDSEWGDRLWMPRILEEVDHVVYLPRLGAHSLAGYTAGVKIAVGWMRDDSRLHLHRRGDVFFELFADANRARPLRDKLRFVLTLGRRALTTIGPDIGAVHDFEGALALASTRLVDHDLLAAALIPVLDEEGTSLYDLYSPYPEDSDHWNRGLVDGTWGESGLQGYRQLVAHGRALGLARDRALARLAVLDGYNPPAVRVVVDGEPLAEGLRAALRATQAGIFRV